MEGSDRATEADISVVVATVHTQGRHLERIISLTGLESATAIKALGRLLGLGVVRNFAGYWIAAQRECAGCERAPARGMGVNVDPETLRWRCDRCQARDVEATRSIAE